MFPTNAAYTRDSVVCLSCIGGVSLLLLLPVYRSREDSYQAIQFFFLLRSAFILYVEHEFFRLDLLSYTSQALF